MSTLVQGDGIQRLIPIALVIGLGLCVPIGGSAHPLPEGSQPVLSTVRSATPTITKQRVEIYRGISQGTAGSKQLSMNRIVLLPGTKGLRHQHHNAETAIYVVEGEARTLIGLNGEVVVDHKAGEFIFIPAGVWHQPVNVTKYPVVAIEARTDADDQSNVILAPHQH